MPNYFYDSETFPIRPGLLAPKLVCVQQAYDDGEVLIRLDDEGFYGALQHEHVNMVGHNQAYDLAVLAAHDESNIQPIFRMLAAGRARDTFLREQLICIAKGMPLDRKGYFTLDACHQRYGGAPLDKGQDSWRTRYALLEGIPVEEWPEEAVKYATEDITALRYVYAAQSRVHVSPDEWFQCAAAFVLQLASVWGMRTDPVTLSWVETSLLTRKEIAEKMLSDAGMLVDGKVKKDKVEEAILKACERLHRPVPRNPVTVNAAAKAQAAGLPTPEGNIKADAETIEEIAVGLKALGEESPLVAKVELAGAVKTLSTYLEPMKFGFNQAMNYKLNCLVSSGRTSSGGSKVDITNPWWTKQPEKLEVVVQGTNMQNPPKEAGVRDCLIPREDHLFSSTDYAALESRVFAQELLWVVGRSVLADGYKKDPNFDPHTFFAGHLLKISYDEAKVRHKKGELGDPEFYKVRSVAKNINFALPGGVGARKFKIMAAEAGIDLTLNECYYYINEWKEAFPEVVQFFDYINYLVQNGKPFKQFVSGRIRGGIGYCDGCNTGFQGLGADISKYAMFLVSMACYAEPESPLYGSRPVVLVHDEILAEHPKDKASLANMEVKRLMEVAEAHFLPDIPAKAEPTLMTRWIKNAKPAYDKNGLIVVDPNCWDIGSTHRPEWVYDA